jgi:hypothetical protein
MSQDASRVVEFHARVTAETSGRVHVPLPFDPDDAWGSRPRHHVTGTLDGHPLRGVVAPGPGSELVLGPSWCRGWRPASDAVAVVLRPEGPQRSELDADIAAALDANGAAGAFFDGLAQFYRKKYLTWIASTKRSPERRAQRIAEMVELLAAGQKERPA